MSLERDDCGCCHFKTHMIHVHSNYPQTLKRWKTLMKTKTWGFGFLDFAKPQKTVENRLKSN